MKSSRRQFLKLTGITAAGLAAAPVMTSLAASDKPERVQPAVGKAETRPDALAAKRWGLVIDTRKFAGPGDLAPIIAACHRAHNVPVFEEDLKMPKLSCEKLDKVVPKISSDKVRHEIKWIWGDEFGHVFPEVENHFLPDRLVRLPFPVLCNHCANPPCVRVCPTRATFQRADGLVLMDFHRCIGCRYCMAACPYGSRSFNFRDPRPGLKEINPEFPTRTKGVVEKCNFCEERLARGLGPACVEVAGGAILFGDLDDPASNVRQALRENYTLRRQPSLGTEPSVYYIV